MVWGLSFQPVAHLTCQGLLSYLLTFFLPLPFQFPDETLRSGELLNMIVAVIDSAQVSCALRPGIQPFISPLFRNI